ncbi:MAG: hypothetical protein ACJARG_001729, partial [Arcticibacterium sp.]
MNDLLKNIKLMESRRGFLKNTALGFGSLALGSLLNPASSRPNIVNSKSPIIGSLGGSHFPGKAKRVIYLFQSGGPSQIESFDYKPQLARWHGQEIPESIKSTQRNSGMVAGQSSFPLVKSIYDFKQYGESGAWISELFPHTAG